MADDFLKEGRVSKSLLLKRRLYKKVVFYKIHIFFGRIQFIRRMQILSLCSLNLTFFKNLLQHKIVLKLNACCEWLLNPPNLTKFERIRQ